MAWPGTIEANKDLVQLQQPLLLVQFVFLNGDTYNVSTHPLNVAEGGHQYAGADYYARVAVQDIAAIQARSVLGIDRIGTTTLHLADQDKFVLNNYEKVYGFKGAIMNYVLILHEPGTTNFSTNALQRFTGICSKPEVNDNEIVIQATTTSPLASFKMPSRMYSQRCQHIIPITPADQADGVSNRSSKFAGCGYCPNASGVTPTDFEAGLVINSYGAGPYTIPSDGRRGNNDPATGLPATWCDYSVGRCVDLGMYDKDSASRITRRFSGQQFAPSQTSVRGKEFISGNTVQAFQSINAAIFGNPIPLVLGQCAIPLKPVNKIGDPNSTRFEVILCVGQIDASFLYGSPGYVRVNGHDIPYLGSDPLYRYSVTTVGTRTGNRTKDAGYTDSGGNPVSDPYGSLALIEIVVYKELATSDSDPQIQVCFHGPMVAVFSTPTSYAMQNTANSAWNLLEILARGNSPYSRLNIQSFIDWAPYCDAVISAPSAYGFTGSYPRYEMALAVVDKQMQSGMLVSQALQSFDGQLVKDSIGRYSLFIRTTLAAQQPSPITGSNFNTALDSVTPSGGASSGYVAYRFNGNNILSIRELAALNSDTPNVVITEFYNKENGFVKDTDRVVDVDDVSRAGGLGSNTEVSSTDFNPMGFTTYQQSTRVSVRYILERLRGNEVGDTRGTRVFEIVSGVGACNITVGQLILVDDEILNYQPITFPVTAFGGGSVPGFLARVIKVQPSTNYETVTIQATWHYDFWYRDDITQYKPPVSRDPRKYLPLRLPYPPTTQQSAHVVSALTGAQKSLFQPDSPKLFLSQTTMADGSSLTSVDLYGIPVPNQFSPDISPPIYNAQATQSAGSSIPAGSYIFFVYGVDANNLLSTPGLPVNVQVAAGAASISITGIVLPSGTVSVQVYGGISDQRLGLQGGSYSSGTYTLTFIVDVLSTGQGAPDQLLDHYDIRAKKVQVPGAVVGTIAAKTVDTLKFTGVSWTTNQWTGYVVSVIGKVNLAVEHTLSAIKILSNTADTLTLFRQPLITSNMTSRFDVGDIAVITALATTHTATTIGCSALSLAANLSGQVRIILGTGIGQVRDIASNTSTVVTVSLPFDTVPDATSVFIVEDAGWLYSGVGRALSIGDLTPYLSNLSGSDEAPGLGSVVVDNQAGVCYLIQLLTADSNDVNCLEQYGITRMVYVIGAPGTGGSAGGYQITY